MLRRTLLASLLALAVFAVPASAKDYAGTALDIMPHGQFGAVPAPPGADAQARMYDGLTPLFNQVTPPDLPKYFKSEALGAAAAPGPTHVEKTPRKGLTIVRDAFDVPHIKGKTRDDLTWGTGWVAEEDRGLVLAVARYPARMAALDVPGVDAFSLVTGLKQVTPTKQADRIIDRQQTTVLKRTREGRGLLHDIDVYIRGANARLKAEHSSAKPFTRVDIYSANALAGQIFGQGGGGETRRAMLLDALRKRLGTPTGNQVFNDLSEHNDEDTPVTVSKRFTYERIPRTQRGNVVIDNGSAKPAATGFPKTALTQHDRPAHASNFLMVGAKRSTNRHPLFVAGPQIGYNYPGLTLEMDLKGPGIEARGAAMPGGPGDILIGRGPDFAWSLTSAGSDTNDVFAETLCGGSSRRYRYRGKCRRMKHINAGTISGKKVAYDTTVHGPVFGYATSHGKRVALSFDRSSRGRDILWQVMMRRMTRGQVTGLKSFYSAAATSPFTFNVAYADDKNIATYSAGRLPIRDKRVDPRLPTKGTGAYDWKGFLKASKHAHGANPSSGELTNWNNKPAPGFGPADDQWTYGSVFRVSMLRAGLAAHPTHNLATVVSAMNGAATMDLRVQGTLLPAVAGVLAATPPPSARDQQMLNLLLQWRAQGASRLDRNLDGKMDAGAAPAIMDAFYPKLADAVMSPVMGPDLPALDRLVGTTNGSNSDFTGGRINYVDKDLRELLGQPLKSPFKTRFCGKGNLQVCSQSLWAALDAAGNELAAAQGTNDPNAWTDDANAERITFPPGGLTTIRYTNRPSGIQQVLTFTGHRKARR